MTATKFEQILSFHPRILNDKVSGICLRDMIYQYFLSICLTEEMADKETKAYIQKLWEKTI